MNRSATGRMFIVVIGAVVVSLAAAGAYSGDYAKKRNLKTIPQTAQEAGTFNTLLAAVQAAGLAETLSGSGPFTVFAPNDEAFAKLPPGTVEALLKDIPTLTKILTYHVVPGKLMAADVLKAGSVKTVFGQSAKITATEAAMIDGASIIATDIQASNGVIHVIDTVIMPRNIVQVAADAGQFKTLVAAINAANLAQTLQGPGPFTVFAPTDEAFAKLPPGTVEALLNDIPTLTKILTYHVVSGQHPASEVVKMDSLVTVQGQALSVKTDDKGVMINDAKVIATDIPAFNGVIHVIDTVVLPAN